MLIYYKCKKYIKPIKGQTLIPLLALYAMNTPNEIHLTAQITVCYNLSTTGPLGLDCAIWHGSEVWLHQ